MILGTFLKQPAERLDYDITYADWLIDGDEVQSCVATPDNASLLVDAIYTSSRTVKIWLSGGVAGLTYKLTVTTTTADGRIKQDELKIKVKEI